jgi:hypothetical protein
MSINRDGIAMESVDTLRHLIDVLGKNNRTTVCVTTVPSRAARVRVSDAER